MRHPSAAFFTLERGFTLTELMVTVLVLSVLAAFAAPSLSGPVNENSLRALANEFTDVLSSARTEAARRGRNVFLCPRSATSDTCDTAASEWANGWILYSDTDNDLTYTAASDALLRVRPKIPPGSVLGSQQATQIGVLPTGEHAVGVNGASSTIKMTRGSSTLYIVISQVGRASVLKPAQCTTAVGCTQ